MSDAVDELAKKMAEIKETELLKAKTATQKAVVEAARTEAQYKQLLQNNKDREITENTDFGAMTPEMIAQVQKDNEEYIKAAKHPMVFINSRFAGVVPFFRKNLILIGGKTGEGKSTTVANIAYGVITRKNPLNGNPMRVLVITNEERAEDFYNRVTALHMVWHYTNHSGFSAEQSRIFTEWIPRWANVGTLTVVDNTYNGSHGVTTTIEGIASIFESLIAKKEWYDCIIIDYYQNIIGSQMDTRQSENDTQAKLTRMLDRYKNIYPAPIVLMAQIMPQDKDDKTPFQQRIKGRKMIMDATTFAMEMVANRMEYNTRWIVHKSRFTDSVGADFLTGYEYGKYVLHTPEFMARVDKLKMDRAAAKYESAVKTREEAKKEAEEKAKQEIKDDKPGEKESV
jgi:replicative DNA helicase